MTNNIKKLPISEEAKCRIEAGFLLEFWSTQLSTSAYDSRRKWALSHVRILSRRRGGVLPVIG